MGCTTPTLGGTDVVATGVAYNPEAPLYILTNVGFKSPSFISLNDSKLFFGSWHRVPIIFLSVETFQKCLSVIPHAWSNLLIGSSAQRATLKVSCLCKGFQFCGILYSAFIHL